VLDPQPSNIQNDSDGLNPGPSPNQSGSEPRSATGSSAGEGRKRRRTGNRRRDRRMSLFYITMVTDPLLDRSAAFQNTSAAEAIGTHTPLHSRWNASYPGSISSL
jgi:hypothetical protein